MKITLNIELSPNANVLKLVQEFQYYKQTHPSAMAVYSQTEQEKYPSDHALFGRDKLFLSPLSAEREQLHHLHFWTANSAHREWKPGNPDGLFQWYCTSDSYLIYSVINHDKDFHHFHIHAVVDPNAHAIYKDHKLINIWAKEAMNIRLGCTSPYIFTSPE